MMQDGGRPIRARLSSQLNLTTREADVLGWVSRGKTNAEIGIILSVSPRTIQKHVEHIFQKLGVETRTAAAARFWQASWDGGTSSA